MNDVGSEIEDRKQVTRPISIALLSISIIIVGFFFLISIIPTLYYLALFSNHINSISFIFAAISSLLSTSILISLIILFSIYKSCLKLILLLLCINIFLPFVNFISAFFMPESNGCVDYLGALKFFSWLISPVSIFSLLLAICWQRYIKKAYQKNSLKK